MPRTWETFREWVWAPTVVHGNHGVRNDWYEVTEDKIDRDEPDCVWRTSYKWRNRQIFELWSPRIRHWMRHCHPEGFDVVANSNHLNGLYRTFKIQAAHY